MKIMFIGTGAADWDPGRYGEPGGRRPFAVGSSGCLNLRNRQDHHDVGAWYPFVRLVKRAERFFLRPCI